MTFKLVSREWWQLVSKYTGIMWFCDTRLPPPTHHYKYLGCPQYYVLYYMYMYVHVCLSHVYRTNGELVNFLKAHSGDNFVKTHGADIKKLVYAVYTCKCLLEVELICRYMYMYMYMYMSYLLPYLIQSTCCL